MPVHGFPRRAPTRSFARPRPATAPLDAKSYIHVGRVRAVGLWTLCVRQFSSGWRPAFTPAGNRFSSRNARQTPEPSRPPVADSQLVLRARSEPSHTSAECDHRFSRCCPRPRKRLRSRTISRRTPPVTSRPAMAGCVSIFAPFHFQSGCMVVGSLVAARGSKLSLECALREIWVRRTGPSRRACFDGHHDLGHRASRPGRRAEVLGRAPWQLRACVSVVGLLVQCCLGCALTTNNAQRVHVSCTCRRPRPGVLARV